MNEVIVNTHMKNQQGIVARVFCDHFFTGMSCVLLIIVLTGFARTFYIRSYLEIPDLPMYLYVHGLVLTAWFSLTLIQTCLVAKHRVQTHRRLGVVGVVLAVGVIAVSLLTVFRRDAPMIDEFPNRALGNLASLIAFSICVASGILLRHRPSSHKRFMLLASIQIVAPALDRIARLSPLNEYFGIIFSWFPAPPEVACALISELLLLLLVLVYDIVLSRRPHSATLWGLLGIIVIAPAVSAAITLSGMWHKFVLYAM